MFCLRGRLQGGRHLRIVFLILAPHQKKCKNIKGGIWEILSYVRSLLNVPSWRRALRHRLKILPTISCVLIPFGELKQRRALISNIIPLGYVCHFLKYHNVLDSKPAISELFFFKKNL